MTAARRTGFRYKKTIFRPPAPAYVRPRIRVKDTRHVDLEGGYLIDGFPSVGYGSAIAGESLIHTSSFEPVGIIDSEAFPPISVVKNGVPGHPSRVFANAGLKVAVFLSYLTLDQAFHKAAADAMIRWGSGRGIGTIISSVAVSSPGDGGIVGIGSTESARGKIREAGLGVLEHGTVPGIPGALLNCGAADGIDVIVVLLHARGGGPDFESSAQLCMAMSKLVPGAACDISLLQKEAEKAQGVIKEAEDGSKHLGSMYR